MKKITLILFILTWGMKLVFSSAYYNTLMDMEQPDGTAVQVLVTGGEYYGEIRSIDGFPLVADPISRFLCYAVVNEDKTAWVSTGNIYTGERILPEGETYEGGSLSQEAIQAIIDERIAEEEAASGAPVLNLEVEGPPPTTPPVPTYPVTGQHRGITLLIGFKDENGNPEPIDIPRNSIDEALNMEGYNEGGNNGSVRDFFLDVSNGKLDLSSDVIDYYIAEKPKEYYSDVEANKPGPGIPSKSRVRELIAEALTALENSPSGYDFSQLTLVDGNNIEAINILYTGSVPSDNKSGEGFWPHRGQLQPGDFGADGVVGYYYQMAPINTSFTIGTFCHETGHLIMRWPDLYDANRKSSGIGQFGLMGLYAGTSLIQGNPLPPNPFLRWEAGWEDIVDLNGMANGTTVSETLGDFLTPRYLNVNNTNEFFMVEYMKREGRYQNLAGDGLVIWHIDMGVPYNNQPDRTPEMHYRVSVEQADGKFDLETPDISYPPNSPPFYNLRNAEDADFYKIGNKTDFTAKSIPSSNWWDGSTSGLSIINVSSPGNDAMTFEYQNGSCVNIGSPPLIDETSCLEITYNYDYHIIGTGADIWGNSDQFTMTPPRHTYFTSSRVWVDAIANTNPWAKAGIMARETLQPNSAHASIFVTPGRGVSFQRRLTEGGASLETTVGGIQAPVWLRLDKDEDGLAIGYYSQDGTNWIEVGRENTTLSRENYLALAVTSHDAGQVAAAHFQQFQFEQKITVTTSSSPNGSVTPEGVTTLNVGELFWVTITPDPGYEVEEFFIDGQSLGKRDDQFYVFDPIEESHTVHVDFARFSEVNVQVTLNGEPVDFAPVTYTNLGNNKSYYQYTDANGVLNLRLPYSQYEFGIYDDGAKGLTAIPQVVQIDNSVENITIEALPAIEYSPLDIHEVLLGNNNKTLDWKITNNMTEPYSFDINYSKEYFSLYSFEGFYAPYQWNSIETTGENLASLSENNNVSVTKTLGFNFPFYGEEYDQIYISSNGVISVLGPVETNFYDNSQLPGYPGIIAGYWTSFKSWPFGDVFFQDFGDHVIIQYNNVTDNSSTNVYSFQIVLYENGNIFFHYNYLAEAQPFFTGLQSPDGTQNLTTFDKDETESTSEMSIGIFPSSWEWLQIPFTNATVQPGETITIPIRFNSNPDILSGVYRKNYLTTRQIGSTGSNYLDAKIPVALSFFQILNEDRFSGDIGSPALAGNLEHSGNTYNIQAAGSDIYGSVDQFYFYSEKTEGDVSITAKVNFLENTDPWAKSGVMIRASQDADAANVMMTVTPENGVSFQYRSYTSGQTNYNKIPGFRSPVALKLARKGNQFTGYYSLNGLDWTVAGTVNINMPAETYSGLAVTSHNPGVLTSTQVSDFRIERQWGWQSYNIGDPLYEGTVTQTGNNFVITGGGKDIWNEEDQFHLVSRSEEGRFSITARVDTIDFTNNWAKAALMVRKNTSAASQFAMVGVTPNRGVFFQYRAVSGGLCESFQITGIKAPVWVKLEKLGDEIIGYYSKDGSPWTLVGSSDFDMGDDVQAGMAVTSHNNSLLAMAAFSSVELNPSLVAGTVLRDVWYNIAGDGLQNLYNDSRYQNDNPDESDYPVILDSYLDWADTYGTRISGYLIPEASGFYTFWLASDNEGKLFLSPDEEPNNANEIAYVNSWTGYQQWDKYPSQQSIQIYLDAGKAYYIEALQKEGLGADNLSVAWEGPGFSRTVIPGEYLAPFLE